MTVIEPGASGFEVCEAIDNCRPGFSGSAGGYLGEGGNGYLAVAPAGAPNAGNVVFADAGNQRVEEYTADGEFIRAFGFDVVAAGPDNTGTGFEECKFGDACKSGAEGSGVGQFASSQPNGVAVDSTGAIYTVEGSETSGCRSSHPGRSRRTLARGVRLQWRAERRRFRRCSFPHRDRCLRRLLVLELLCRCHRQLSG